MKRKREIVDKKTEIKLAIEELSLLVLNLNRSVIRCNIHNRNHNKVVITSLTNRGVDNERNIDDHLQQQLVLTYIPTRPFLSLCSLIVQVLDKIGPTMAVLRQDIYKNIQRLEMLCDSDPTRYSNIIEILMKEAGERNAKKTDSCSKALVWLTRSLDFTAALLQKVAAEPRNCMEQIVENSYETTLKPWHGWISAAAYKVALKLVPETDTFISVLKDKDENLDTFRDGIRALNSLLVPLLEDLHSTLSSYGLEKLKST